MKILFDNKPIIHPQNGDKRKRTWFAWVPVFVNSEMRWFETVTVLQIYSELFHKWDNFMFIDEKQEDNKQESVKFVMIKNDTLIKEAFIDYRRN